MKVSLNCLLLENLSFNNAFTVNVNEKNNIGNSQVDYEKLTIGDLKYLILDNKKNTLGNIDYANLNLWKVNIAYDNKDKLKNVTTEGDIEKKLEGEELIPTFLLEKYFPSDQPIVLENIHIIVQAPTTGKCLPTFYLSIFCQHCITFTNAHIAQKCIILL
jgi:hypothetical protein